MSKAQSEPIGAWWGPSKDTLEHVNVSIREIDIRWCTI